ncbi:MAG: response regulator [Gammaproteobacteria bacterium]
MKKILYVEDNEDNIYMLSRWLRRQGHEVLIARDGDEGIALARSESPALIIMDLILPKLDGWEATRQLKAGRETAHIPIVALSASAMPGDLDKARDAGCDDVDTKPVDFNRLQSKLEALL